MKTLTDCTKRDRKFNMERGFWEGNRLRKFLSCKYGILFMGKGRFVSGCSPEQRRTMCQRTTPPEGTGPNGGTLPLEGGNWLGFITHGPDTVCSCPFLF